MDYKIVFASKLDRIVSKGNSIQSDIDCIITVTEDYLSEVEQGKEKILSSPMKEYILYLKEKSLNSLKDFELELESISNYDGDLDYSFFEFEDFNIFEILKGPDDKVVFILEEYLSELEYIRDFIDDIVSQLNDHRTSAFLDSDLIN